MPKCHTSILLPVYNGARYLRQSIESVLAQTDGDFELLVCDDASTDESRDIAASFADARIVLMRNENNRGLFPTLNRLASVAQAPRLRLWAQDDIMLPGCLAAERAYFAAQAPLVLAYCQYDRINEAGTVIQRSPADDTPQRLPPSLSRQIAFYWGSLTGNISTTTLMRDAFERAGGFRNFRVAGDFDLWVRLGEMGDIGFIPQTLVQVRSHAAQLSQSVPEWLTFLREDRAIYQRLFDSLPDQLKGHGRLYHECHRGRRPINYALRCLLRRDFRGARDSLAELRHERSPWRVVLLWLATANGHLWLPKPRYVDATGNVA